MSKPNGGFAVPDWVAQQLHDNAVKSLDLLVSDLLASSPPLPPSTRSQRIRRRIRWKMSDAKWGIHDRMFGKHGEDW
jgi:hypothetical protein